MPKVGPKDFQLLRVIGRGAFGKVLLVRHYDSGALYAMKVLSKSQLRERGRSAAASSRTERDIMSSLDHPFLVKLRFAFQTSDKLYLVIDYCAGGELFTHMRRSGCLSEDIVRVYAAEIVLALGYLHGRGIVHRDIKPENLLLDAEGHLRLSDYGLAKEMSGKDERARTICGTSEYFAPEMVALYHSTRTKKDVEEKKDGEEGLEGANTKKDIFEGDTTKKDILEGETAKKERALGAEKESVPKTDGGAVAAKVAVVARSEAEELRVAEEKEVRQEAAALAKAKEEVVDSHMFGRESSSGGSGYTTAVDWWALGCVLCELLMGRPPFQHKDEKKLFQRILTHEPRLPKHLSEECKDLIAALLNKNPEKRLGAGRSTMFEARGVSAVRRHPWFSSIDWRGLESRSLPAPLRVSLTSAEDVAYFDKAFTAMPIDDTVGDPAIELRGAAAMRKAKKAEKRAEKLRKRAARKAAGLATDVDSSSMPSDSSDGGVSPTAKAQPPSSPPDSDIVFRGFSWLHPDLEDEVDVWEERKKEREERRQRKEQQKELQRALRIKEQTELQDSSDSKSVSSTQQSSSSKKSKKKKKKSAADSAMEQALSFSPPSTLSPPPQKRQQQQHQHQNSDTKPVAPSPLHHQQPLPTPPTTPELPKPRDPSNPWGSAGPSSSGIEPPKTTPPQKTFSGNTSPKVSPPRPVSTADAAASWRSPPPPFPAAAAAAPVAFTSPSSSTSGPMPPPSWPRIGQATAVPTAPQATGTWAAAALGRTAPRPTYKKPILRADAPVFMPPGGKW